MHLHRFGGKMNHPMSKRRFYHFSICIAALFLGFLPAHADQPSEKKLVIPEAWEYTAPLVSPEIRETEPSRAQKDPTIVFHDGRWRKERIRLHTGASHVLCVKRA